MGVRLGQAAELRALHFLRQQGLRLLTKNWSSRYGEIDLVMIENNTVVFIEVRLRSYQAWGGAAASVSLRKRERLIKTAHRFLQEEPRWSGYPCRFDVVTFSGNASTPEWIRDAFTDIK